MFDDPSLEAHLPRPSVFFMKRKDACYEDMLNLQIEEVIRSKARVI